MLLYTRQQPFAGQNAMQIEHKQLGQGMVVWVTYSNRPTNVLGPLTVKSFYSGHQGRVVVCTDKNSRQDQQFVLADDDDYGETIFHDCQPITRGVHATETNYKNRAP
jgi:hypothetical protein